MVRITVDVDGGASNGGSVGHGQITGQSRTAKAKKIGLVSAIKLDSTMKDKFLAGAGLSASQIEYGGDVDQKLYGKESEIRTKKDSHKTLCDVIATIGGNYAFMAINADTADNNTPFVSLLGNIPAPDVSLNDKFLAGVTLESFVTNALRKNHIKKLRSLTDAQAAAQIFLYANKNSKMHAGEVANWASNATVCLSTAGGNGGVNDPAGFATDFTNGGINAPLESGGAAPGATPTGIVISDDPFFRAFRDPLIKAVNTWLKGDLTHRYVIYPSQVYANPVVSTNERPLANNSTLYGPDLNQAVFLLGMLARYCSEENNQSTPLGFFAVPNLITDIK